MISELLSPKPPEEVPSCPVSKAAIVDIRLFANSLSKLVSTMHSAGLDAHSRRYETENYIEYKVRIQKNPEKEYQQLRIC